MLFRSVPETPRWLISKNRNLDAVAVLRRFVGADAAAAELSAIENSFTHSSASFPQLFAKSHRPVLTIGVLIAIFQQITGINAILYYSPIIFSKTGLDTQSALLQTIGIGVINLLATLLAIGLIDRVGRRKLLLAGCFIMGISLVAVAVCFRYNNFGHYAVLVFMLIYVAGFSSTLEIGRAHV